MPWPVLVFDIESIPDITGLRALRDAPAEVTDQQLYAAWLQEREQALSGRTQRLLRWGKPTIVLALGAVGPLSSLLAIRLFGLKAPRRYALAVGAATVYCVVWTGLIYGGGWLLVQHLLSWSAH